MIPLIKSRIAELEKGCGQMYNDEIPDDDGIPSEFEVGCLKYSLCSLCQAKISAWKEFLILAENGELLENKKLNFIRELISSWYDTSIKDGKIALMITNGGYISKFALLEEFDRLRALDFDKSREVFGGQT